MKRYRVDDHLVVPETTRDEMINGRRVVAHPAKEPHATLHGRLVYVLGAHAAPGYTMAADLLTRLNEKSDFASDACLFKDGTDPETGARHLEEIVFEVATEQDERDVTEKAQQRHHRGVRRIFTVFVEGPQRVCEWQSSEDRWRPLEPASHIEDICLAAPLAVAALLEATAADNAVMEALAAKDNPVLRKREDEAEARRERRGMARLLLRLLEEKFGPLDAQIQDRIQAADADQLLAWSTRLLKAAALGDVLGS
jgi:hypothetical protein